MLNTVEFPPAAYIIDWSRRTFAPNAGWCPHRRAWLLSDGELAASKRGILTDPTPRPVKVNGVMEIVGTAPAPRPAPVPRTVDIDASVARARRFRAEMQRERERELELVAC